MKLSAELQSEIQGRHAKGQSDQSIADWLLTLDPPVEVTREAISKMRNRKRAAAMSQVGEKSQQHPEQPAEPIKPSGSANRKRLAADRSQEAADHGKRGGVILDIPFDPDPMRSHLYELRIQLELQRQVAADEIMTLPDKVRFCTQIGQTIARLRVDAEIEADHEEIRKDRARELAEMQELEQELEREKKRLAAMRRELEAQLKGEKAA